ncbi:MAG TPA: type IV secretion system DNA-binding domain-containing protein [Candidatus Paceibacterota bacterium]|nr:type IV secretion system DNA-binding domain-containing protein [Candidatus Paceibacterota bacterium]
MADDDQKITYFAQTNSRGKDQAFGIKRRDRVRHMYIIGKTGMGKSTLLENMAIQDIRNGEGMAFIDPHGGTADRIMEYVPEHRIKDVVYFAPFDMEHPIAFNVMEDVGYDKRHLVVSGLLSAFRKIWVDAWSARMEYILANTLLALLEYEGSTLLDVNRMLVNKKFRAKVVDNVTDPIVKSFWADEFAAYSDRYTQEATPAIQNKIGQFTSNPLIRNIVGQAKSSFDFRQAMDDKKILIINLSKGRVGEVNATLLGSMLVTKIYLAAMSRADVSADVLATLPQFYFYVDEFQSFSNQSFADILSEARKYKLNLIIAHQYIEQMEEEVRDAVFGNVGTTVTFRVGPFDAEVLETVFSPQFEATDLVNLGFAQIYLTLMIDGVGSTPFSATTLPPFDPPPQKYVDQVIENSRRVFSRPRAEVEETIRKWHEEDPMEPLQKPKFVPDRKPAASSAPRPRPAPAAPRAEPKPQPPAPTPVFVEIAAPERAPERPAPPAERPAPAPEPAARVEEAPRPPRPKAPEPRREPERRAERPRPTPPPVPETPPLSGAKSLREALAEVVARKADAPPAPPPRQDQGYGTALKDALKKVAPAAAEELPKPKPQATPAQEPAGLPEDVLRSMLSVDPDLAPDADYGSDDPDARKH